MPRLVPRSPPSLGKPPRNVTPPAADRQQPSTSRVVRVATTFSPILLADAVPSEGGHGGSRCRAEVDSTATAGLTSRCVGGAPRVPSTSWSRDTSSPPAGLDIEGNSEHDETEPLHSPPPLVVGSIGVPLCSVTSRASLPQRKVGDYVTSTMTSLRGCRVANPRGSRKRRSDTPPLDTVAPARVVGVPRLVASNSPGTNSNATLDTQQNRRPQQTVYDVTDRSSGEFYVDMGQLRHTSTGSNTANSTSIDSTLTASQARITPDVPIAFATSLTSSGVRTSLDRESTSVQPSTSSRPVASSSQHPCPPQDVGKQSAFLVSASGSRKRRSGTPPHPLATHPSTCNRVDPNESTTSPTRSKGGGQAVNQVLASTSTQKEEPLQVESSAMVRAKIRRVGFMRIVL